MTNTFSSPAQRIFTCILGLLLFSFHSGSAQSSDVILQGFYWNSHPGDPSDPVNGGIWWDSLAEVSPELAGAGISTIWAPPMTKGFGNLWDMGYGLYEYYDLGEYDQKGSTRTRHGTRAQLDHFLQVAHNHDLKVMADIVLNHRGGGDAQTTYEYNAGPWAGATEYMIFHPASGRFPGEASHFHPNNAHPDQDPDWHDPIFFNDICYFNQSDQIGPPDGWYHGVPPFGLGHAADSLIDWGRWLMEEVGFDEMRIDAVKHIDPAFLAKFLVETAPGEQ
ncbi:MAG: alpha-amylase family glycosyl hydrolase, partial [Bacteroidota bacterium]